MRVQLYMSLIAVVAAASAAHAVTSAGTPLMNAQPAAGTVARIRKAGELRCALVATPEDWNKTDLHGPLTALDLEICKAVAVAVLGPVPRVEKEIEPKVFATEDEAEQALSKGMVDLVVGVTPSASAMSQWGISFGPPVLYDGQGLLVRRDLTAKSIQDLAGRTVCVIEGTDNEKILHARLVARGIAVHPFDFQEEGEMDDAVATRHCDVVSAYLTRLADLKRTYADQLGRDYLLPEVLSLSPVVPAYRQGDAQWSMIVDWTVYALIQAEDSGVTRANVESERANEDPVVQRLLGVDWASSRALGIESKDWAAQVIESVGNYGEVFDRTVGSKSALNLPRGMNALWSKGGLMHPWPVQ